MSTVIEAMVSFFLVAGAVFALLGSWGLARLPDFYSRLHGPSKASTLGACAVEGREAKRATTEDSLVAPTSPGWVPWAPAAMPKWTGCSRVAAAVLLPRRLLGVGGMLVASMLYFAARGEPSLHELLITLFLFISTPVSAHLLVKAALHLKVRAGCGLPLDDDQAQG